MLKTAYEEAKRLLTENREALDKISAFLIEKETITGKEFMKIFREVKGIEEPEESNSESKKEGRIAMKEVGRPMEEDRAGTERPEEVQAKEDWPEETKTGMEWPEDDQAGTDW